MVLMQLQCYGVDVHSLGSQGQGSYRVDGFNYGYSFLLGTGL